MIIINETDLEAHLFRTIVSEDWHAGTLVAKQTYSILADGSLTPSRAKQAVFQRPTAVDGVVLPPDGAFGKAALDVLVIGSAFAPGGAPLQAMLAGLTINEHQLLVAAIGDRVWQRSRTRGFAASEPVPFVEMPLVWPRSFGGRALMQGTEVPHVDNPEGRGLVLDLDAAEGVSLPNIEDPTALVRAPLDQPSTTSFCPLPVANGFVAELLEGVDTETGEGMTREIFNVAVPKHRLAAYPGGGLVEFVNLTPQPVRPFRLPDLQVVAEVSLGTKRYEFAGEVDTLCFLPSRSELVVTHRVLFRYEYLRRGVRAVRLRARHANQAARAVMVRSA
jgi:hypothetical protein